MNSGHWDGNSRARLRVKTRTLTNQGCGTRVRVVDWLFGGAPALFGEPEGLFGWDELDGNVGDERF